MILRMFIILLFAGLLHPASSFAQVKLVFHKDYSNWLRGWLSEFYNREVFEWSGKNINWSNPPFIWSVVNGFPMSEQSAIFVLHRNSNQCGNSSCNFDIWVFDGKNYNDISGNMANKFDEDVEISDRFQNEMPIIFIGPRAYAFNGSAYQEI